MILEGPQALRAIEDALKDVRREEDEITGRVARSAERVAKLKESELAILRDLAQMRLAPKARAALQTKLEHAERQAQAMLEAHNRDVSKLEEALEALEERLDALSRERGDKLDALCAMKTQFETFQVRAQETLDADSHYRELGAACESLAHQAQEAERKTALAAKDERDRGASYLADPLFAYLHARDYGTPDYRGNPLTRFFDAKVAALIGFEHARTNFLMLSAIPERLGLHANRLRAESESARAERAALEERAVAQAGGSALRADIAALAERIAAIDAEILSAEDERDRLTAEHKAVAEGADANFDNALALLADAMESSEAAALQTHASGAESGDALGVKLEDIRVRVSEDEAEMRDQRGRLATLEARRRELEDIAYQFKTEGFDDPHARFGQEALVGDTLNAFLRGAITAPAYWAQWQSAQSWSGSGALGATAQVENPVARDAPDKHVFSRPRAAAAAMSG